MSEAASSSAHRESFGPSPQAITDQTGPRATLGAHKRRETHTHSTKRHGSQSEARKRNREAAKRCHWVAPPPEGALCGGPLAGPLAGIIPAGAPPPTGGPPGRAAWGGPGLNGWKGMAGGGPGKNPGPGACPIGGMRTRRSYLGWRWNCGGSGGRATSDAANRDCYAQAAKQQHRRIRKAAARPPAAVSLAHSTPSRPLCV